MTDFYPCEAGMMGESHTRFPKPSTLSFTTTRMRSKRRVSGPPKTWMKSRCVFAQLVVKDTAGKTMSFVVLTPTELFVAAKLRLAHGGKFDDEQWNVYLDSPEVMAFMTRTQKLSRRNGDSPNRGTGNEALFGSGRAMMIQSTES
jgi:hypothetical protein